MFTRRNEAHLNGNPGLQAINARVGVGEGCQDILQGEVEFFIAPLGVLRFNMVMQVLCAVKIAAE